jgi:2-polyprenyl-3-methyl-5-hydroxy-6-metoxy-1,4-benzoquinol methylase
MAVPCEVKDRHVMDRADKVRSAAYGQNSRLSPLDKLGVWMSGRRVRRETGGLHGQRVGDIGCGFNASFARSFVQAAESVTLVDVSLSADLKSHPKIECVEGVLPEALDAIGDDSLDVVLCLSVLEHLWNPDDALEAFVRILRPGGTCLINVPSWRGKWFLEFSAFRLGLSPAEEMDDHKRYFDPSDLWPLLVRAGFLPHNIRCFRHKFGLNTFACCGMEAERP